MELKSLQIEVVLTEMIAERNKIIIELNEQCVGLKKQLEEATAAKPEAGQEA
jgi:hypothetical protein